MTANREPAETCDGCGLVVAGGTAGCQTMMDELLARHFSDATYFGVHRLFVDAYCLQHPGRYCASFFRRKDGGKGNSMEPTLGCITLPVDDIERSLAFYRDGLGLAAEGLSGYAEGDDHVAIKLKGGPYLVLVLRSEFAQFTSAAHQVDAVPESSECILTCFTAGKEEVDTILESSEAAGGAISGEAIDQPWGYAGYVKDPDGHLWEVMWNPLFSSKPGGS